MTKKLLRPALATVAILAVGAAAAVAGANFATPTPAAETATTDVPVLQPIGYGDRAPALDSDGDPASGEVSPIQGFRTLPIGADGLPDPGLGFTNAIGTLLESDAPDASGFSFDVVDGEGDDACAPEGDAEVEGCPDGIRGAIFALVAPDDLWARGSEPHAPSPELPNYAVQCEPVEHPDTSLQYGFVSNAPGTVSLRYWPRGNEAAAVTVEATTPEAPTAAWEAGLAESDAFEGDWTNVNTCLVLADLEPYVRYVHEYTFTDILDRTYTREAGTTYAFGLPEDRTVPPTRIQPVSRNAILLSAPHTDRVSVRFNVQIVDEGETADCSLSGDRLPLVDDSAISTTVDVSPEFLADNGYLPQYTQRTSTAVFVPEGSTIIACVAEVDDNRPGWQWLEAQRHAWRILQTPDSARPLVSIDDVTLFGDVDADSVSMSMRWPNNQGTCGLWRGPAEDGSQVDAGEFRSTCGDDTHPITQDDATVSISVTQDGETVRSSFVLPLSSLACTGGCATPPTTWFSVPLSIEGTPVEMCGSGMRAPCDPADARGAVGTASVKVDWVDGASNGLSEWQIGSVNRADVEHVLDPLPQMDWTVRPTVTTDERTRKATISFPLRADRPVEYTATLSGDCERPAASFTQTGTLGAGGTALVNLRGACLGLWYDIAVTLTDDEGNTSTFALGTGTGYWPDARVKTPGIPTGLYLWYHVALEESVLMGKVMQLRVAVDGQEIDPLLPENDCFRGTSFGHRAGGPLLPDAAISEQMTIEITMQLGEGYGSSDSERAYCDAGWAEGPVYTMSAVATVDELGRQLTFTVPDDAPYTGTFTIGRIPAS